jgi:hypothetical protein
MTLTISQLQQMYGTSSVQTLRGANPSGASAKADAAVDVLEQGATALPNDIIPDEDNPLFMTWEQRIAAYVREEKAHAEAHRIEVANRVHTLSPRIKGALGDDMRLQDRFTVEQGTFLEAMKVKYAHMKDVFELQKPELEPVTTVIEMPYFPKMQENPATEHLRGAKAHNERIDKMYSDFAPTIEANRLERAVQIERNDARLAQWQENKERMGNSFVMTLFGYYEQIVNQYDLIISNDAMIKGASERMKTADAPRLESQIATHKHVIIETAKSLRQNLAMLEDHTDGFTHFETMNTFFKEYAAFHSNAKYDLTEVISRAQNTL